MFRPLLIFISLLCYLPHLQAQIKVKARVDEAPQAASEKRAFTNNKVTLDLGSTLRGSLGIGYEWVIGDLFTVKLNAGPTFRDPLDDRLYTFFLGSNRLQSVTNNMGLGYGLALRYYPEETGRFEGITIRPASPF